MTAAAPCPACKAAETDRHSGLFHARCRGCEVRALALSIGFFDSRQQGRITKEYGAALRSVFGPDVDNGHALVKAEHQRLRALS